MNQHRAEYWNADGRREFRHRIEHRRSHAAFVLRKPITPSPSPSPGMSALPQFPAECARRNKLFTPSDAAAANDAAAQMIVLTMPTRLTPKRSSSKPHGNLQCRVGPVCTRWTESKQHRGHAKRVRAALPLENREIYAVKITDGDSEPEQARQFPIAAAAQPGPVLFRGNPRGGQLKPSRATFVTASSERSMAVSPAAVCAGGNLVFDCRDATDECRAAQPPPAPDELSISWPFVTVVVVFL